MPSVSISARMDTTEHKMLQCCTRSKVGGARVVVAIGITGIEMLW